MTVAKLVPVLEAATAGGYGVWRSAGRRSGRWLMRPKNYATVMVQTSSRRSVARYSRTMSMYRHAAELRPCRWCSI
jgi:hypothetical protein